MTGDAAGMRLVRHNACAVLALEVLFWLCVGLVVWTQLGYAAALAGLARLLPSAAVSPRERTRRSPGRGEAGQSSPPPSLSLIGGAHDEQSVIADTVHSALSLDYPRERLEVIVACDGCGDETAGRAREAGADGVVE